VVRFCCAHIRRLGAQAGLASRVDATCPDIAFLGKNQGAARIIMILLDSCASLKSPPAFSDLRLSAQICGDPSFLL
jgi:hypothetical protein